MFFKSGMDKVQQFYIVEKYIVMKTKEFLLYVIVRINIIDIKLSEGKERENNIYFMILFI